MVFSFVVIVVLLCLGAWYLYEKIPANLITFEEEPLKEPSAQVKTAAPITLPAKARFGSGIKDCDEDIEISISWGKKWSLVSVPSKLTTYDFIFRTSHLKALDESAFIEQKNPAPGASKAKKKNVMNMVASGRNDMRIIFIARTNANPSIELSINPDALRKTL